MASIPFKHEYLASPSKNTKECECACNECFEQRHCGNTKCGLPDAHTPSDWEGTFDKEFVATGAEIVEFKRLEYPQLRSHQVEQVKQFVRALLASDHALLVEKIEAMKRNVTHLEEKVLDEVLTLLRTS